MILLKIIENSASKTPDSIALIPNSKGPISYRAFRNTIWGNMKQLMNENINSQTRIGLITADPFEMALWLYSVSALCIAVPMDHNMSISQYDARFKLFNLDYILLGKGLDPSILSSIDKAQIPTTRTWTKPMPTRMVWVMSATPAPTIPIMTLTPTAFAATLTIARRSTIPARLTPTPTKLVMPAMPAPTPMAMVSVIRVS